MTSLEEPTLAKRTAEKMRVEVGFVLKNNNKYISKRKIYLGKNSKNLLTGRVVLW